MNAIPKPANPMPASERIDLMISEITDWRGDTLALMRKTILAADPEIFEEWKWMGSPVWSKAGIIAGGNPHKGKVKLTFANGAHIPDPDHLFNGGLAGNQRREIDIFEGDTINLAALQTLVRAAISFNQSKTKKKSPPRG